MGCTLKNIYFSLFLMNCVELPSLNCADEVIHQMISDGTDESDE